MKLIAYIWFAMCVLLLIDMEDEIVATYGKPVINSTAYNAMYQKVKTVAHIEVPEANHSCIRLATDTLIGSRVKPSKCSIKLVKAYTMSSRVMTALNSTYY